MHWIRNNWFLIILLIALFTGYHGAERLRILTDYRWLTWVIVALTMFAMAWPVEFGQIRKSVSKPLSPLLASVLNVIAIPIIVWPLALWVGGEMGMGMLIAAAAPSTLASAAVWTRRAGGDDSVPMIVTIITNGTCFLVMPFWIYIQSGQSVEAEILTRTVLNLLFFVVLPIVVAQVLRLNRRSAAWATQNKLTLSVVAMIGILTMVLIGAVSMGLRMQEQTVPTSWSLLILVAVLMGTVHIAVFWGGMWLARLLGRQRPQQIAVGFAASQKTLMTGLSVCISLGVSIVPIVLYHSIQLIVDTAFADHLRYQSELRAPGESSSV
jgi:sodium/bile acid cotransporter 7